MSFFAGSISFNNTDTTFLNTIYASDKYINTCSTDCSCLIQKAKSLDNGRDICFNYNNITIVYDGIIYNSDEIYSELASDRYNSDKDSFAELIYHSYCKWGCGCVKKFNGTFAFALWDNNIKQLLIARDKFGVKPLFFSKINDEFIFASDIEILLKHPLIKPEIDTESIAELILIGPGRTPGHAIFKNIRELKPACLGYFSEKGLSLARYWKLEAREHKESLTETAENIKYLLTKSIKRQTVPDSSACAFLSGGLDSSIITAISGIKNTFSVDYEDNEKYFKANKYQPNSDKEYIEIVRNFLGTKHTTITINADDLVESLYLSVKARNLPGMADIDGSMLLLCERVKKGTDIALSGECADEFFGGYPWYRDEDIRNIDGFPWSQSTEFRKSFIKNELLKDVNAEKYAYNRYVKTKNEASVLKNENSLEKRMKELFNLNMEWFMKTLLDRTDRMSGYSGLDVRIPFCDTEIVEYAYNIPWEFKNYMGREKGLLRMAMEGLLPEKVIWRKKSPYPKTHNPEYLTKVSKILTDIISSANAPLLEIVKKEELVKLLSSDSSVPWYGQLMTAPQIIAYFIQINYWLEYYKISIV